MSSKESTEISLQFADNYKDHLDADRKEILQQFLNVLSSYIENIKTTKLTNLFNIIRGVETIFHVYTIVLSHTKNLKTAVLNAHKAMYLYTEFSEQISEESNMVLQLSSREAALYVYKKTLYELLPSSTASLDHVFHQLLFIKTVFELGFSKKTQTNQLRVLLQKFVKSNYSENETKTLLDILNEDNFMDILETKKTLTKK